MTPWLPIPRPLALLFVAALALSQAACYSAKPNFPANVHTIAVDIFQNKNAALYRDLEFELTEALQKQVELRTPYKIVPAALADTVLTGTITNMWQMTLAQAATGGMPQEMELHVVIDFDWKDARTGQAIRSRKGFEAVGRYVPQRPIGETVATGQRQAIALLADQIIDTMRSDW